MKKIKLLSLIMALVMVLSMFAACSSGEYEDLDDEDDEIEEEYNDDNDNEAIDEEENDDKEEDTKAEEDEDVALGDFLKPDEVSYDSLPDGFTATKVGNIKKNNVSVTRAGLYYRDTNGKYGVMSYDGKNDTGAKYVRCSDEGTYFSVSEKELGDPDDFDAINATGLIDMNGKELIPAEYGMVKKLSDRYYKVLKATEKTDNKDESIMYLTSSMFTINPSDDDVLYKGVWYIYDVTTGKKVEGVSASNAYSITIYGNTYIEYVNDAKQKVKVNSKGEVMPEDARLHDNGFYSITKDNKTTVYNEANEEQFSIDAKEYFLSSYSSGYFSAVKYGNPNKYVLIDEKGNFMSGEYNKTVYIEKGLLLSDGVVYDLNGNEIISGGFNMIKCDKKTGNAWYLTDGNKHLIIDKKGNILYEGEKEEGLNVDYYSEFVISKKAEDGYDYYCFGDKDYTIKNGWSVSSWVVRAEDEDGNRYLVNTMDGETLIKGYVNYSAVSFEGSLTYVYAYKSASSNTDLVLGTATGSYDIYIVK